MALSAIKTLALEVDVLGVKGTPICVRIIPPGEAMGWAGPRGELVYNQDVVPKLAFYDKRYLHTLWGQHITHYNLDVHLKLNVDRGLDLAGGIPEWKIDGNAVKVVVGLISAFYENRLQ